ncbi:MAG: hypothetical protein IPI24_00260 [Ignavibacteria bacterium]|nr:hypothetical protein [Ignavibacteria bacterium]
MDLIDFLRDRLLGPLPGLKLIARSYRTSPMPSHVCDRLRRMQSAAL